MMTNKANNYLVIAAGGKGLRFASAIPKQYHTMINNKTILDNTISKFIDYPFVKIVVALNTNDKFWRQSQFYNHPKIITTTGGKTRMHSVAQALMVLTNKAATNDLITTHDAVRPLVNVHDIQNLIDIATANKIGAILVAKCYDSLKYIDDNSMHAQDRKRIYRVLTPQIYRFNILQKAITHAIKNNNNVNDESSAVDKLGYNYQYLITNNTNIKITTKNHLTIANALITKN